MDGKSGPLKMWQIWALYDIAADFYADPENQAAFEAWQKQREKCKKTKRPCRRDSTGKGQGVMKAACTHHQKFNTNGRF